METSKEINKYFAEIDEKVEKAYGVAKNARAKGYDPEEKIDIPIARNMAERVEGLISAVAPQLIGKGMIERINELEKEHGRLSWEVALKIALEVAQEKFCKFKDKHEAMVIGIRTGFAYHTVGIVSAPLEGIVDIKVKKRKDGKEYIAIIYASPIRGAGGTAAAVSIIISDYVRKNLGYSEYDADEGEANRAYTELEDYHERIANLQYHASEKEIKFLVSKIPVEIDGDPTEKMDVSNYKDLPRIETNKIRGGFCLVLSMLALKAPKVWKELNKWGEKLNLNWDFLKEFLDIQKTSKALDKDGKSDGKEKIKPDYTYISDLVAGRPVLSHPLASGGFRLRYGRARNSGYSSASIHPATSLILNRYIATGTQLKVERPGKATAVTMCDTIEGPIVKLYDGRVLKLSTEKDANHYADKIKEILYLGDILFSYGDFYDRAHKLVPAGYCEEWWIAELEKAAVNIFGNLDIEKISELLECDVSLVEQLLKNPHTTRISPSLAIKISTLLKIPLHPEYTYHWKSISIKEFENLVKWLNEAKVQKSDSVEKIVLPLQKEKRILELIGIPHIVSTDYIVIEKDHAATFLASLGIENEADVSKLAQIIEVNKEKPILEILNLVSAVKLRDKSGTFIGARMGRPEKAKMRKLTGSPHSLFPCGAEGGRLRCFQSALEKGHVKSDFPIYKCENCNTQTIFSICETCGKRTKKLRYCKLCGIVEKCSHENYSYTKQSIDIKRYFQNTLKKLNLSHYPDLIKGVRGMSNKDHIPEHIAKGILRAKHNVFVNKDGTTRYDMTEIPITHFKPIEIGTSIQKLKELGYEKDINNRELEDENQILELKPQDVILPCSSDSPDEKASDVLLRIAKFTDELLTRFYDLEPFYNFEKKEDIIGHLVIGLAPHISAGIIGRIIGFSDTQGCYAHPLWHAAHRRDCDGDENCFILLMDALLNFSRQYLPDKRGSRTMDSPLVLTTVLNPSEVDDMVHKVDVAWRYPIEFYEATLEYKQPWDIKIDQIGQRLGTEKQYEQMGFTHDVSDINIGVKCSAYKTLPTMEEKLRGQMDLAERIRAVDASDVARLVIEKHFLKDTRGNLRKFSMQKFRCSKCNEIFRRPPLIGKCTKCGGNIIFTISEGSIIKYLEPSISLAKKYDVPQWLKQSLELTKRRVEGMFGKDKEKQAGLGSWFG